MNRLTEKIYPTNDQWIKLENLYSKLSKNNKYYSNIFTNYNITLENLRNNFKKLPILTKKKIRENFDSYLTQMDAEVFEELTSGSTGTPLKCYKTQTERYRASMLLWHARRKIDPKVNPKNFFQIVGMKTYIEVGDFCDFSLDNMQKCFNRMMNIKPRWICGPTTAIYKYARLIKENLVQYTHKIKYIEFSGEYVDPGQKKYIEEAFQCRTLNQYGTRECWCIAYECEHYKFHVVKDVFVETTNHNSEITVQGREAGEIVITSLLNTKMPFIRYNIGDYGVVTSEHCSCGTASQMIYLAGGRTGDLIKGSKSTLGDIFFKRAVNDLIEAGYDAIDSFRVEQVSNNAFVFYIVPFHGYFPKQAIDLLLETIKKGLGQDTIVDFQLVHDIPQLPSGKTKTFVSLV